MGGKSQESPELLTPDRFFTAFPCGSPTGTAVGRADGYWFRQVNFREAHAGNVRIEP